MIELERHIEILLLDNDCVIVPDLGGFMTHHREAHFDSEDNIFLPPQRTLGFNPQLKLNDSILAQSYVEAYDISYPEAIRRIETEVSELKQHLANDGFYELNDIGCLSINLEGKLEFEPCEAGILTPELYGLSTFEFAPLNPTKRHHSLLNATSHWHHEESTSHYVAPSEEPDAEQTEKGVTIRMSWIRNTVAIAAALLAFLIMTTPVDNSEQMQIARSEVNLPLLSTDSNKQSADKLDLHSIQSVLNTPDTIGSNEDEVVITDTAGIENEFFNESKTEQLPQSKAKLSYCIVLASQVSQAGAEDFVRRLHKQGYADANVHIYNNVRRVVCGCYATETEARQQLNYIHQNEELKDAWLYKITD